MICMAGNEVRKALLGRLNELDRPDEMGAQGCAG